ncbi:MAG: tetratricopeptide repeat protein [Bacteroidetes bacterium]|nr:tetratricopeptide repeat protein [Bacteroidota bacterium]
MKLLLYTALFLPLLVAAQPNLPKKKADSLWAVWSNPQQPDTNRLKAIHDYAWNGYLFTKPDSAFYYTQLEYDFAKTKGLKKQMARALNTQGVSFYSRGDYANAIVYYTKSLKIKEEIGDKRGIAASLGNIGNIYINQRDDANAITYYTKSLKIQEEIRDRKGIANVLNNLGLIYDNQGHHSQAIDYFTKSLKIFEETGYKQGKALSLNNIGNVYRSQGDSATDAGNSKLSADKYAKAIDYHTQSLKIREEIEDKQGIAISLNNIGNIYTKQDKFHLAFDYNNRALNMAQELGAILQTKDAAYMLWKINKRLGKHKESLEMYELYIETRDSILSEENQKEVMRQEFQYNYGKKAAADSVANAKANEIRDAHIAQQTAEIKAKRNQQYALYGGLFLVLVFAGFIYNRFKITQKQKGIIEEKEKETSLQKHTIEEKHKEITDSIHYAKRIQDAMLTSEDYITEHFNAECFILFKPKDIVAGDFYWAAFQHNKFYIATADCTGHGVPGAFMSLLNISFLNENVIERGIQSPALILNEQRKEIIKALNPKGNENSKDGMDCVLCAFDITNLKLEFSAANNPVWIIRSKELIEFKPDKMPVGKYEEGAKDFSTHTFDLQKGDTIYTFTDGYADQFGGEKGKKFKYSKLKELLLSINQESLKVQKQMMEETFMAWKGDLEQVDDVLVIGVKI